MKNKNKRARDGAGRKRVYSFLVEFIKKNGYSPSIREICIGTGLSSTATVYSHLERLKFMGMIDMKEKTSRTISLVGYKFVKTEEPVLE